MRTQLSTLVFAATSAFVFSQASSAFAQEPLMTIAVPASEAEQKEIYNTWPADKQASYDAWPEETQTYYWTLSAERQDLFWLLPVEDRVLLTSMSGPERESAWLVIEQRAAGDVSSAVRPK